MDIRVGQVMEFVEPVSVDGRQIARGTRVRVAHIMHEVNGERISLVLLGNPETIVVDRHIVGVHCRPVADAPAQR